jgi:hypothetical protein
MFLKDIVPITASPNCFSSYAMVEAVKPPPAMREQTDEKLLATDCSDGEFLPQRTQRTQRKEKYS